MRDAPLASGLVVARAARLKGWVAEYGGEASGAERRVAERLEQRLRDLAARAAGAAGGAVDAAVGKELEEVRALIGDLNGYAPWRPIKRFLKEVFGPYFEGAVLAPSWRGDGWGCLPLDRERKLGILYFDGADARNPLMWPLLVRAYLALRQRLQGDVGSPDVAAVRLAGPALFAASAAAVIQFSAAVPFAVREYLAGIRAQLTRRGTVARFVEPWQRLVPGLDVPQQVPDPLEGEEGDSSFGPEDLRVAEELLPRLAGGVLIASRRAHAGTPPDGPGDIYARLKAVEETPNTPAQIVNAGWLYYTLELLPRLPTLDFDQAVAEVAAFDALIGKSLLVAAVHRFFTGGGSACRVHF